MPLSTIIEESPGKILIVDDEDKNRKLLRHVLNHSGYEVVEAGDGVHALSALARDQPDLVLLDIMMPNMDGYEVCKRMQSDAILAAIPVIFITALYNPEDEVKGFALGAVDYITKPFKTDIVLARIRTHMALKKAREKIELQNKQLLAVAELREDIERMSRHDLKNPLTSIITAPQLLLMRANLSEKDKELVRDILKSGHKMLHMINSSLDIFKMEQGVYQFNPAAVDLLKVIFNIVQENESLATGKSLAFRILIDDKPAQEDDAFPLWSEEFLCYFMLANLIKNALEASPENKEISIELTSGALNSIRIHNWGMVPETIQANFFDKYVTAGKDKGTGLGTYSAKLMAKTLQGEISYTSSLDEGTTIVVSLPAVPAP